VNTAKNWTPWGNVAPSTNPQASPFPPQAANDNLPRLIALTGLAGSGKSTAADYLIASHGYVRVRFAGPLKAMIAAIGLDERHIEGALKETPIEELCDNTPRYAMQTLGTEWGRKCMGEDFWVNLWRDNASRHTRVVVDDCRFPNEARAVKAMGGVIWEITGRGGIAGGHESERGIGMAADAVIVNSEGIGDLPGAIEEVLKS